MRYVSVFGDSISTYEGYAPEGYAVYYEGPRQKATGVMDAAQTWWARVVDAMGAVLLANASWSGSMVEGAGFPAGNSPERIEALSRDGVDPDDILVFYGINDYGWGSAHAQAAGRASSVPFELVKSGTLPPQAIAGDAPVSAALDFGVAYTAMLARMHKRYPRARIWCFALVPGRVKGCTHSTFTYSYRGAGFADYNTAIARAAREQDAIFCDTRAYGFDYEGIEGTHPTALGMEQLAWLAKRSMVDACPDGAALVDEATEAFPGGDAFRADNPCGEPGRSCVGCPHALATGNRWMLVCQRRERDIIGNVVPS